jgi:hypothetical protein
MKLQLVKYSKLSKMLYEADVVFVDGKTIKDRYDKAELNKWEHPANLDHYEVLYWNEKNRILQLKTKSDIQIALEQYVKGFKFSDFERGGVVDMPFVPFQNPADPNAVMTHSTGDGPQNN